MLLIFHERIYSESNCNCVKVPCINARSFLRSPFEATPTTAEDKMFSSPFLLPSLPSFHTPTTPPTAIGHASRSLCNATPYAFIRAYPHDKHRTVIDICPYRSKGSGIIRPSNNVVGGGYRDHRDNVVSPDHNCDYRFLVFTARETRTFDRPH